MSIAAPRVVEHRTTSITGREQLAALLIPIRIPRIDGERACRMYLLTDRDEAIIRLVLDPLRDDRLRSLVTCHARKHTQAMISSLSMTLDLTQLLLLGLFTSSLHWLIARSTIAKPLWSRAGGWFGRLLECSGCSGWWLGLVIGGLGWATPVCWCSGADCATTLTSSLVETFSAGLFGVFLTPVFEAILLWGLRESAVEPDEMPVAFGSDDGAVPAVPAPLVDSNDYITPVSNPTRRKT